MVTAAFTGSWAGGINGGRILGEQVKIEQPVCSKTAITRF